MISLAVAPLVRKVADDYKDIFYATGIEFNSLCAFLWCFLSGSESLSELVRACGWSMSVSSLSRDVQLFQPNRVMRRMRIKVLKKFKLNPQNYCYAVDDTANRRYGKSVYNSSKFGGSGGVYQGQKILVVALVNMKEGYAIPVSYQFLTSKKEPHHVPAPQVALKLLSELLYEGFPRLAVTVDSWFDSHVFMTGLMKLGLHYYGEIKSNRKVMSGSCRVWKTLSAMFKKSPRKKVSKKYYSESELYIRRMPAPVKCVAMFNEINDKKAFGYYLSTDAAIAGAQLWRLSRMRWKIECMFRDLKQNLAFGRLPCSGKEGSDLSVCIPILLITSLRLVEDQKCKGSTIGTRILELRESEFRRGLSMIERDPDNKSVVKFFARRSKINEKPTDKAA